MDAVSGAVRGGGCAGPHRRRLVAPGGPDPAGAAGSGPLTRSWPVGRGVVRLKRRRGRVVGRGLACRPELRFASIAGGAGFGCADGSACCAAGIGRVGCGHCGGESRTSGHRRARTGCGRDPRAETNLRSGRTPPTQPTPPGSSTQPAPPRGTRLRPGAASSAPPAFEAPRSRPAGHAPRARGQAQPRLAGRAPGPGRRVQPRRRLRRARSPRPVGHTSGPGGRVQPRRRLRRREASPGRAGSRPRGKVSLAGV